MVIFFRDPDRQIAEGIVSPADGRVMGIYNEKDNDVGDAVRVSIFMSLWDVHINRIPIDGKVLKVSRFKGGFAPAFLKKSSNNERVVTLLGTEIGVIKITQIAGAIARRIITYVKEGKNVKKGEKMGIIKFGSRVDIILPREKVKICVKQNQKIKAGVDTIAKIID